jgi:hypothetical protein
MMNFRVWIRRLDRVVKTIILARVLVWLLARWPLALDFFARCTASASWRFAARLAVVQTVAQAQVMALVLVWAVSLLVSAGIVAVGYRAVGWWTAR